MTTITKIPTLQEAYKGNVSFIHTNTLFATLHGSHAYGLNTETSDIDVKGVAVAPRNCYIGFSNSFEQAEQREPYDLIIYEVQKFCKLAAACNPNIIEVLHTSPSEFIHTTRMGHYLLDHKDDFISLKAKHTFSGYAHSQLQRIQTHYRWLKNPPQSQPQRVDFGLPQTTVIPADQLGVVQAAIMKKLESFDFDWNTLDEANRIHLKGCISLFLAEMQLTEDEIWIRTGRSLSMDENFLELLKKERQYKAKLDEWRSYQTWLETRNEKRAALESKFGYDTKHGMHLVRLMKMCREIMLTGRVNVKRTEDREELLAIRNNGIWSYDQLIEWSTAQEKELNMLYNELKKKHIAGEELTVPFEPDREHLDEICMTIINEYI